jgi:purine-binding chemotaxis protein CheW
MNLQKQSNATNVTNEIEVLDKSATDLPWLVFRLHDLTYTINSRIVTSILQIPENVTPVTSAGESFRGIINFRGIILPLLDMRKYFGLRSFLDEQKILENKFATVFQAHLDWFAEFKSSIVSGKPFSGALDSHSSKLGEWIYAANEGFPEVVLNGLKRVQPINEQLHKSAAEALVAVKSHSPEERLEYVENSSNFQKLSALSANIKKLFDEINQSFVDSQREMVVVTESGDTNLGLIVDEVVAVDFLTIVSDEARFPNFQKRNLFNGVANSTKLQDEILLINESILMQEVANFEG